MLFSSIFLLLAGLLRLAAGLLRLAAGLLRLAAGLLMLMTAVLATLVAIIVATRMRCSFSGIKTLLAISNENVVEAAFIIIGCISKAATVTGDALGDVLGGIRNVEYAKIA